MAIDRIRFIRSLRSDFEDKINQAIVSEPGYDCIDIRWVYSDLWMLQFSKIWNATEKTEKTEKDV